MEIGEWIVRAFQRVAISFPQAAQGRLGIVKEQTEGGAWRELNQPEGGQIQQQTSGRPRSDGESNRPIRARLPPAEEQEMRNSENATLVALLVGVFFTCWPLLVFLYQKVEGSEVANGSLGQTFLFCLVFVPPLGFSAWCWNLIRRKRSPVWSGLHTPALLLLLAQIGLVVVLLVLSSPAP